MHQIDANLLAEKYLSITLHSDLADELPASDEELKELQAEIADAIAAMSAEAFRRIVTIAKHSSAQSDDPAEEAPAE